MSGVACRIEKIRLSGYGGLFCLKARLSDRMGLSRRGEVVVVSCGFSPSSQVGWVESESRVHIVHAR